MPTDYSQVRLQVRVAELADAPAELLELVPVADHLSAWLGTQIQIVGWGEAKVLKFEGRHQIASAAYVWQQICANSTVIGEATASGSHGNAETNYADEVEEAEAKLAAIAPRFPLALASFGFVSHTPGYLVVPEVAVVRMGKRTWAVTAAEITAAAGSGAVAVTSDGSATEAGSAVAAGENPGESAELIAPNPLAAVTCWPVTAPQSVAQSALQASQPATSPGIPITAPTGLWTDPGRMTQSKWKLAVRRLTGILRAGAASKVVLTRDILVSAANSIDERFLAARLHEKYPTTWTYAVKGLIGASPEMLAVMKDGQVVSRVLAGTAHPGQEQELLTSAKDRTEHHLAVESVACVLAPFSEEIDVPSTPEVLVLPNVVHLATRIRAKVKAANVLDVVEALHPTAAVCGTPTRLAFELLKDLETTERGRYSGPVGWIDSAGEGEFAIALRCGQLSKNREQIRVFAGGGIMPDSIPEVELAETRAKMRPVLEALGLEDD